MDWAITSLNYTMNLVDPKFGQAIIIELRKNGLNEAADRFEKEIS